MQNTDLLWGSGMGEGKRGGGEIVETKPTVWVGAGLQGKMMDDKRDSAPWNDIGVCVLSPTNEL